MDFAADARLIHVIFAPSPTAYLLLGIAVDLGMKREGRRLVRDDVGELAGINEEIIPPTHVFAATLSTSLATSAAYLSLVVSASLRVRRDERGLVGDALGEKQKK